MSATLVFTSCMDAQRSSDQPVWQAVQAEQPDLLLLLGDQIYMDWGLASLSKESHWRRAWRKDPDAGLQAFVAEMHRRYRLQWQVPSFRQMLMALHARGGQVLMTWDDHDFAWNNAYGADAREGQAGLASTDPRHVPPDLRHASWHLLQQFRQRCRTPPWDESYPPCPALEALISPPIPLSQLWQTAWLGPVPVFLTDQRWWRQQRDQAGPNRLLGAAQQAALGAWLEEHRAGLRVVAGASPLRYDYRGAHQGWWAPPQAAGQADRVYPEYRWLLDQFPGDAGLPLLYLGGDVHRNVWSGPQDGSSIVQALSTGAALGDGWFSRPAGRFGVLRVEGTSAAEVDVSVTLCVASEGGGLKRTQAPLPGVQGGRWAGPVPDGRDVDLSELDALDALDTDPILVLNVRERQRAHRGQDQLSLAASELDTLAFDDSLDGGAERAEWVRVEGGAPSGPQGTPQDGDDALRLDRRLPDSPGFTAWQDGQLQDWLARAHAQDRTPLLFIHGFGKSFSESLAQACQLRRLYDVEPLLYAWPSGDADGWLGWLGDGLLSGLRRHGAAKRLGKTLEDLAERMPPALTERGLVIAARSLGAEVLALALARPGARDALTTLRVQRLVLSAPALATNEKPIKHLCWAGGPPVVATCNADDRVLGPASPLLGIRKRNMLGLTGAGSHSTWLQTVDLTGLPGVEDQHDTLCQRMPQALHDFNRCLLRGESLPVLPAPHP